MLVIPCVNMMKAIIIKCARSLRGSVNRTGLPALLTLGEVGCSVAKSTSALAEYCDPPSSSDALAQSP